MVGLMFWSALGASAVCVASCSNAANVRQEARPVDADTAETTPADIAAADVPVAADVTPAAAPPSPVFREAQGCTRDIYVDETAPAALRRIRFTHGLGMEPERCMRVLVGQTVTFVGDLSVHPLAAAEGDPDNPIAFHEDRPVTFPRAGVFGFVCGSHPGMRGAIWAIAGP